MALLTDFGLRDGYVGVMKAVIGGICPQAIVIDLCHEVEPQNVAQGAFILKTSWSYFPEGTVLLAVVDPGVGGDRGAIAVRASSRWFVGPDNGLLSWAWLAREPDRSDRIIVLENDSLWLKPVSHTFHGRDVFAPVAAHLAAGIDPSLLGRWVSDLVRVPRPEPRRLSADKFELHVVHIDRFGNLITDLEERALPAEAGRLRFEVGGLTAAGVSERYSNGQGLVAIVGSAGHLEIASPGGSAAALTGARPGSIVTMWSA